MEGDVIVPKITPTFEADRSTWVKGSPTRVLTGTTELHVVRPGPRLEPGYLDYLFSSGQFLQDGASRMVGVAGQKRISDEWLRNYRIPVVDLEMQQTIINYLGAETACIDALISKKRHLVELLEERDRCIIDDLFGNVVRGRLTRLGYVADVRSGVTLGGSRPRATSKVTVPYLRVANVQHDRLDLGEVKTVTVDRATAQRTMLHSGDVLMTEGGDIDKLGRGTVWRSELNPCLHQNHVFAVRVRTRDLLPEFLALVTRTSHARRYFEMTGVRSTNLASTNASKVSDFKIPFPSPSVQADLVREYRGMWEISDQVRHMLLRQLDLLAERRQTLITAVVTGEMPIAGVAA